MKTTFCTRQILTRQTLRFGVLSLLTTAALFTAGCGKKDDAAADQPVKVEKGVKGTKQSEPLNKSVPNPAASEQQKTMDKEQGGR
jgi:hypothetical protein